MALTILLRDLQPLYGWQLALWHGDHGWHGASAAVAKELVAWARIQDLTVWTDRAEPGEAGREAAARHWRYGCLARRARHWDCQHVVAGHTATDRAETVLLNLARGCHRRGLASMGPSRPLTDERAGEPSLALVRPLLAFDRADTADVCRERRLPVWLDPSNNDTQLRRNRLRAEVLPVLEACHPGACRRISLQAERLAEELATEKELLQLAIRNLEGRLGSFVTLDRAALAQLSPSTRGLVLAWWLRERTGVIHKASSLDSLEYRLRNSWGHGRHDLQGGWCLSWTSTHLALGQSTHGQPDARSGPDEPHG